jgi:hypothetical protein
VARASVKWQPLPAKVSARTLTWANDAHISAIEFAETQRTEMERWAKTNAPWQNRTGNARKLLHATVEREATRIRVVLAHGVDYGKWLEVRWDGRFGILLRTTRRFAPTWASFFRRGGAR